MVPMVLCADDDDDVGSVPPHDIAAARRRCTDDDDDDLSVPPHDGDVPARDGADGSVLMMTTMTLVCVGGLWAGWVPIGVVSMGQALYSGLSVACRLSVISALLTKNQPSAMWMNCATL